jgi:NAD(P)-dependent dehydrogenase (short-subunit alcohol dehydrogenase family)
MAEKYLSLGADLFIVGRRAAILEETAKELMGDHGGSVVPLPCDIKDAQSIEDLMDDTWSAGPLTGLVNNAAGNFISQTHKLSPCAFNSIADIVMRGTFYVTNAAGRRWIEGGDKGTIISILTTWVWNGSAHAVPSAMSKTAVAAMTRSLAVEWGKYGIRINAIAPGAFPSKGAGDRLMPQGTDAGKASADAGSGYTANPMGRVGQHEEHNNLGVFLMADGCDYLNGEIIGPYGGGWLANGGNFSGLTALEDEQWDAIRNQIKSTNEKDKAQRIGQ